MNKNQKNLKPKKIISLNKNKAKFELSAGGIIYNPKTDQILLVEDFKNRFTFPKGNNEKGESMVQTAQRETSEETGVKNLQFIAKIGEVRFFYQLKGEFRLKKIVYFLFTTADVETLPQKEEIKSVVWISRNKVTDLIPFKNLLPLWQIAQKLIHPVK
jgi:8-oxo-dGTP diphosphatase